MVERLLDAAGRAGEVQLLLAALSVFACIAFAVVTVVRWAPDYLGMAAALLR
ncbi:MAG TPA: hypothetical protein VF522_19205 [Ramlibacter sp.]|uniref:hypothetical protein n=1 Tax=Ramlibacter sp. TaxID=1917967 RepID=UPI002ED15BBD